MRLINADDAIKKLKEYVTEMESDVYYGSNLGIPEECICEAIEEVHTIEAEPVKHGEWLDVCCAVKCSCCDETYNDEIFLMRGKINYCPNCGSKLENNIFL